MYNTFIIINLTFFIGTIINFIKRKKKLLLVGNKIYQLSVVDYFCIIYYLHVR